MNKYPQTIHELFDALCTIEKQYNLFELQVDGIHFWKLIRFSLFNELAKKSALYGEIHPASNSKIAPTQSRLNKTLKIFKSTLTSPLRDNEKYDILLFPHARKLKENDQYRDIYSWDLEMQLSKERISFGVIESTYNGYFLRPSGGNVYHDSILTLKNLPLYLYFRYKAINLKEQFSRITEIAGIPISEIDILSTRKIGLIIRNYKRLYSYYKKVLGLHRPKKIYIVCAYGKEALVAAAHFYNIEVIEIQHGAITNFHIGYSYPEKCKIPYFPDRLRLWGKYWYDNSKLPLDEKYVEYVGFPYLKQELNKFKSEKRYKKRLLFLSQGSIAEGLQQIAIGVAISLPECSVVYRFHPSESPVWHSIYPKFKKAVEELDNLSIEHAREEPLYRSFAKSFFVVGVYSTAILESIASGCNIVLANLPGVEFYKELYEKGNVSLINNSDDLVSIVTSSVSVTRVDVSYLFSNMN